MSNMFNMLSMSLAEATSKDELLCRGVLRMTILNSTEALNHNTGPAQTMSYITKMNYMDWKDVIEGPALPKILVRLGMKETSALTARLMETLVEQQSLLTMSAH